MTRTEHAPVDGTHTTKLRLFPGAKPPVGTPGVSAAVPGTPLPGTLVSCRGLRPVTASTAAMTSTAATPAAMRHRLGSDGGSRKSRFGSRP